VKVNKKTLNPKINYFLKIVQVIVFIALLHLLVKFVLKDIPSTILSAFHLLIKKLKKKHLKQFHLRLKHLVELSVLEA